MNNPLNFIDPSGHWYTGPEIKDFYEQTQYGGSYYGISSVYDKPETFDDWLEKSFNLPVRDVVDDTTLFGQNRGEYYEGGPTIYHPAIDIGGPAGTNIYAVDEGVVVHVGYNKHMGYTVIIRHIVHKEYIYSIYAHLGAKYMSIEKAIFVKEGVSVYSDTIIGIMGTTKGSLEDTSTGTTSHLHYEVRTSLNVNEAVLPSFPLSGMQWWMNQDGGASCNPWTLCWLDLGKRYGYHKDYYDIPVNP